MESIGEDDGDRPGLRLELGDGEFVCSVYITPLLLIVLFEGTYIIQLFPLVPVRLVTLNIIPPP